MSTSLPSLGTAFVFGCLAAGAEPLPAVAQPAGNRYHWLAAAGGATATAAVVTAYVCPDCFQIQTPTPAPQETETASEPPSTTGESTKPGCPDIGRYYVSALEAIVKRAGPNTAIYQAFAALQDTQGICPADNMLQWNDKFALITRDLEGQKKVHDIDDIAASDMRKSVMWGIDPVNRPFIAVQYTSDQVKKCVATFFQHYPNSGQVTVAYVQPYGCPLGPLDPLRTGLGSFSSNFRALLRGNPVYAQDGDHRAVLKLVEPTPESEVQGSATASTPPLPDATPPQDAAQEV